MHIGEIEEIGTIEPLVVPELLPEHERADRTTEPALEPAEPVSAPV